MTDCIWSLRVLVVDDNQDAADSLLRLIRLWGHEAQAAYDESAIDLMVEFQPDVVLLDIGMPRMDGPHMARHMRLLTKKKDLLIVAVTGYHDESIKKLSREAGIDQYLVKPIDLTVLDKLLAVKRLEQRDGQDRGC
jgi:CheY-like chemotaxis protein